MSDGESKRNIGNGMDDDEINKVFDALNNRDESKEVNKNLKKQLNRVKEIKSLFEDAQKHEMSGHFDDAVKLYNQILVIDSRDSEAYEGLIRIYDQQGNSDEEEKILKSAISNLDGSVKIRFMEMLKELKQ